MKLPVAFWIFACLCCAHPAFAKAAAYYALSPLAVSVYEDILRLEMSKARGGITQLQSQEPENLASIHLENYIDFFQLYLTEDADLLAQRRKEKEQRIALLEQLPNSSPWRNYAIAEIRLHWALIFLRFESYLPAFREVNKANKLLLENAQQFPDFLLTYKDLGLLQAAVGNIPAQFKWAVDIFSSLKGDIAAGAEAMTKAMADKNHPFYKETAVLYALLQLHLRNAPDTAWEIVKGLGLQPANNKLHCFVLANMAMRSERNDEAIRLLEKQPRGGSAEDFAYLDFMLGLAKLRKLDNSARLHFQSFLLRFRGQHFIKEAVQKIAWAELLRGRPDLYRQRISEVEKRGKATAGGDQNAAKEATTSDLPHLDLLKARLLFDGAYYDQARKIMDAINPLLLGKEQQQWEYYYRIGRILHGQGDWAGALSFYERTISLSALASSFFACNAALQAGLITEEAGKKAQAKQYFERCLSISPDEYATGLHIQAKAGLNRLSSR